MSLSQGLRRSPFTRPPAPTPRRAIGDDLEVSPSSSEGSGEDGIIEIAKEGIRISSQYSSQQSLIRNLRPSMIKEEADEELDELSKLLTSSPRPLTRFKSQSLRMGREGLSQRLLRKANFSKLMPKAQHDVFSDDPFHGSRDAHPAMDPNTSMQPSKVSRSPPLHLERAGSSETAVEASHKCTDRCERSVCVSGKVADKHPMCARDDFLSDESASVHSSFRFASLPARFRAWTPRKLFPKAYSNSSASSQSSLRFSDLSVHKAKETRNGTDSVRSSASASIASTTLYSQYDSVRSKVSTLRSNTGTVRSNVSIANSHTSTVRSKTSTLKSSAGQSTPSLTSSLRDQDSTTSESRTTSLLTPTPRSKRRPPRLRLKQAVGSPPPPTPSIPGAPARLRLQELFEPPQAPDPPISDLLAPPIQEAMTPRPPRSSVGARSCPPTPTTPSKLRRKGSEVLLRIKSKIKLNEEDAPGSDTSDDEPQPRARTLGAASSTTAPAGHDSLKDSHAEKPSLRSLLSTPSRPRCGDPDSRRSILDQERFKRFASSSSALHEHPDLSSPSLRVPEDESWVSRMLTPNRRSRVLSIFDDSPLPSPLPSSASNPTSPIRRVFPSKLMPRTPTKLKLKPASLFSRTPKAPSTPASRAGTPRIPDFPWREQWCTACGDLCSVHSPEAQDPFANLSGASEFIAVAERHSLSLHHYPMGGRQGGSLHQYPTGGQAKSERDGVSRSLGRGTSKSGPSHGRQRSMSLQTSNPVGGPAAPATRPGSRFKGYRAEKTILERKSEGEIDAEGERPTSVDTVLQKELTWYAAIVEDSEPQVDAVERKENVAQRSAVAQVAEEPSFVVSDHSSPSVWSQSSPPLVAGAGSGYRPMTPTSYGSRRRFASSASDETEEEVSYWSPNSTP